MTRTKDGRNGIRTASILGGLLLLGGCQGPDSSQRNVPLTILNSDKIQYQLSDGPRNENAKQELKKQADRIATGLFKGAPMGQIAAEESEDEAAPTQARPVQARPSWADGASEPPSRIDDDIPEDYPIVVRRGETPRLLASWSGLSPEDIITGNSEVLNQRKWLKVGDRLSIPLSPNQRVVFDLQRDQFQQERMESFFSKRYFKEVVVYRVKRGEYIANAAKRYGDVPLWLIEEFNQLDFRSLSLGDEVLIPVVEELPVGMQKPPPLRVVDEQGRPLTGSSLDGYASRLEGDFVAKARMAIDDSNVFMRGEPIQAAHGRRGDESPLAPRPLAAISQQASSGASAQGAASGAAAGNDKSLRQIIVKRGESLMHYVSWSKESLSTIENANSHVSKERIFVGSRIAIPMTDEAYVAFMEARSKWHLEKDGGSGTGSVENATLGRAHVVQSGETATGIARQYRLSLKALRLANPEIDLDLLRVGQKLNLPE